MRSIVDSEEFTRAVREMPVSARQVDEALHDLTSMLAFAPPTLLGHGEFEVSLGEPVVHLKLRFCVEPQVVHLLAFCVASRAA